MPRGWNAPPAFFSVRDGELSLDRTGSYTEYTCYGPARHGR